MERLKACLGISAYSVCQPSLEEVFLAAVGTGMDADAAAAHASA